MHASYTEVVREWFVASGLTSNTVAGLRSQKTRAERGPVAGE